jgi:branched-subunit amino acid aminotransferase/4-amino-4-deoxychorismate lyase
MHSDLTYDVPSAWDGKFFRLEEHLARLEGACGKIRLRLPLPKEEIKSILTDMLVQSGIKDAFIELIVTRGLTGVRGAKPGDIKENLYMFIMPCEFCLEGTLLELHADLVLKISGSKIQRCN